MAEKKDRVVGGKVTDFEKCVVELAAHDAGRTTSKFVAEASLAAALEQLSRSSQEAQPDR
jgi:uncharacterized protein (DUF1778 family)